MRPDEAADWVRAADAEINDDLVPAGLELPGQPVLPRDLRAEDGLLAEQYFDGMRRRRRPEHAERPGPFGSMARLRIRRGRDSPARPGRRRPAALAGRPATAAGRAGRHRARQAGRDRAGRAAALGRGGPQPEGQLARRARRRAAPGHRRGLRGGRLLLPAAVPPVRRGRAGRAAGAAAAGARGGRGLRHLGQHDRGPARDGAGRGGGAAAGARAGPAGPRAGLRHRGRRPRSG